MLSQFRTSNIGASSKNGATQPTERAIVTTTRFIKRKILIDEGFPRQALLMTIVKDEHDEGHAILTVKTNAGDFVLDNLNDEVKPWNRTGYRFVKRQSQTDQNVWLQSDGRARLCFAIEILSAHLPRRQGRGCTRGEAQRLL